MMPSGYSARHGETDEHLHYIAGLSEALEDVLDGVPEMTSNSREAAMIRSVLAAIQREAKTAQEAHTAEWKVLKAAEAETPAA